MRKKKAKQGQDPRVPAWAGRVRYSVGYGGPGDMIFHSPLWLTVHEVWHGATLFAKPQHHHASLVLRAVQWANGHVTVDLIPRLLPLHVNVKELLADLLRNGWVRDGDVIRHQETEERRSVQIARSTSRAAAGRVRDGFSKRRRFAVLQRCGFACVYCGRRSPDVELHVDHVTPLARGGNHDEGNLVAACVDCNLGKATSLVEEGGK